jgi:hypothetical protein
VDHSATRNISFNVNDVMKIAEEKFSSVSRGMGRPINAHKNN